MSEATERYHLEDRIIQLEATCAAMREALLAFQKVPCSTSPPINDYETINGYITIADCKRGQQALSTDAGKSLLERLHNKRDEWRKAAGERLDLLTKAEGRALELLERLQTAESALAPIKAELTEWQTAFAMFKGTPNELAAWVVRNAARLQSVEKERDSLQTQRDQVLHLLSGGELTEEQVKESGLGIGVLSEQRHHEYMRTKAEAERNSIRQTLRYVTYHRLPLGDKVFDCLPLDWQMAVHKILQENT